MTSISRPLHPDLDAYASKLLDAGFTVYLDAKPRRDGSVEFFHYSREVDGRVCYGTVQLGEWHRLGDPLRHTMPLRPSRLNGSGALVAVPSDLAPDSVEYAAVVAQPSNYCPYNAEPTQEALDRAAGSAGVPKRFYRGATLYNAEPWGIGTHYLPAHI